MINVSRVALVLASALSFAAGNAPAGAAVWHKTIASTPFSLPLIQVGESTTFRFQAFCTKDGKFVKDQVRLTGAPPGTRFVPAVVSTTTSHVTASPLVTLISDKLTTTPGDYTRTRVVKLHAQGVVCGKFPDSVSASRPLIIVPIIEVRGQNGKLAKDVWWFGTADGKEERRINEALGWDLELNVTAFPKNQGRYSWSVTSFEPAESYATLEASDRTGTDLDTIEPFVKLVPGISPSSDPAKALPKGKGQVWLTLKVNGATSFSKFIDVRRPYQALYRRVSDHLPDKGYETWTYQSDIYYTLYDQFSKLLPRPVVVREHFDPGSPITDLFYQRYGKHSRWRRTNEAGGPGKLVSIIKDGVQRAADPIGLDNPHPQTAVLGARWQFDPGACASIFGNLMGGRRRRRSQFPCHRHKVTHIEMGPLSGPCTPLRRHYSWKGQTVLPLRRTVKVADRAMFDRDSFLSTAQESNARVIAANGPSFFRLSRKMVPIPHLPVTSVDWWDQFALQSFIFLRRPRPATSGAIANFLARRSRLPLTRSR